MILKLNERMAKERKRDRDGEMSQSGCHRREMIQSQYHKSIDSRWHNKFSETHLIEFA